MSIIAKKPEGEGSGLLTPAGTVQAVCFAVWDLGYQQIVWNNQTKTQQKIVIAWEINKTIDVDGEYKGKRYVISNQYTLSLFEKAKLRKHLESWFNKSFKEYEDTGFDLEKLVGKNCLVNIAHAEKNDKTYANVSAVVALPDNVPPMTPENTTEPPAWVTKKQSESVQAKSGPAIEYASDEDIKQAFSDASSKDINVPL